MAALSINARDWALLILRIIFGITFVLHGYPKLFPNGPGGFIGFVGSLGFPAPAFLGWVVALLEFFGGIAMIVGVLVRPVAILFAIEMIATTVVAKMNRGVPFITGEGTGWELDFVLFGIAVAFALLGAGAFSIDAMRARRPA